MKRNRGGVRERVTAASADGQKLGQAAETPGGETVPVGGEPGVASDPPARPEDSRPVGLTREMDEETRRKIVEDPLGAMRRMPMDPE